MERSSCAFPCTSSRTIRFNIDYAPIWAEPLGDETLRILLHECAHAKVTGHNENWGNEAARLGGVLARWVGENHDLWKEMQLKLEPGAAPTE